MRRRRRRRVIRPDPRPRFIGRPLGAPLVRQRPRLGSSDSESTLWPIALRSSRSKLYRLLPGLFSRFYLVSTIFTGFYWVLPSFLLGFTSLQRVRMSSTGFYGDFPSEIENYRVLLILFELYLVLLGLTGHLLGFTRF